MKNRSKVNKEKGSDSSEGEDIEFDVPRELTVEEKQEAELANTPVIPDSEISPAAYIFTQHQDEQDELQIYEEK